jgi:hypothetical protein
VAGVAPAQRSVAGSPNQLQIMYGLSGERQLTEWEVPWLPGYQSPPCERALKPHRRGPAVWPGRPPSPTKKVHPPRTQTSPSSRPAAGDRHSTFFRPARGRACGAYAGRFTPDSDS